jgi:hypothetical protein
MVVLGPPLEDVHATEKALEVVADRGDAFLHRCHQRESAQGTEPGPWCAEDVAVVIELA